MELLVLLVSTVFPRVSSPYTKQTLGHRFQFYLFSPLLSDVWMVWLPLRELQQRIRSF